jgi:hypothetical protein
MHLESHALARMEKFPAVVLGPGYSLITMLTVGRSPRALRLKMVGCGVLRGHHASWPFRHVARLRLRTARVTREVWPMGTRKRTRSSGASSVSRLIHRGIARGRRCRLVSRLKWLQAGLDSLRSPAARSRGAGRQRHFGHRGRVVADVRRGLNLSQSHSVQRWLGAAGPRGARHRAAGRLSTAVAPRRCTGHDTRRER